jgi:hypothetical protein
MASEDRAFEALEQLAETMRSSEERRVQEEKERAEREASVIRRARRHLVSVGANMLGAAVLVIVGYYLGDLKNNTDAARTKSEQAGATATSVAERVESSEKRVADSLIAMRAALTTNGASLTVLRDRLAVIEAELLTVPRAQAVDAESVGDQKDDILDREAKEIYRQQQQLRMVPGG